MKNIHMLFVVLGLAAGCGDEGRDMTAIRAALANPHVKLGDMVAVAEASMADGHAIRAELLVTGAPVYAYDTVGGDVKHDVRVDIYDGRVVSNAAAGQAPAGCAGSVSLAAAITAAEGQVSGGSVIAAIPDDDVDCAREIQVLDADTLWEVKVDGSGAVLSVEVSDEIDPAD